MSNDLAKSLDGYVDGSSFQTEILVVTLDDNLSHPYFKDIQVNKDNVNPIGNAVLTTLYTNDILNYWANYTGIIVVSVRMLDSHKDNTNSKKYFDKIIQPEFTRYQQLLKQRNEERGLNIKTDKEKVVKQVLQNEHYNYSFIGRVSRFKQRGKEYILYLEDLGWKFMQKVPMEFRKAFVAGQSLDDAFQAICEFMGVEFAYSIEDLHEYTFAPDGYSIQKDGQTIEDVPQILREWANGVEEDDKEDIYDATGSNSGLDEYNKKAKKEIEKEAKKMINNNNKNNNKNNTNNDDKNPLNKSGTDSNNQSEEEKNKQSLEEKKKQYQEEFDEKIRNLFIGNTFYDSDLCNPILNYGNITIEPKSVNENSNMSTTGNTGGNNNNPSFKSEEEAKEYWGEKTRSADVGLNVRFV